MNSFQIFGVVAVCLLVFSGAVSVLTLFGVPMVVTFGVFYLSTIWFMSGMQRRARECAELQY